MLQTIFKYKNSILGIIVVLMISFAMLGFGVDFFGGSADNEDFAIKVNDQVISNYEYNSTKENYVNGLRERLGEMYTQVSSLINIDKQVRESLINQALNVQFAKDLGITSGDKAIALRIMELFPEDTTVSYSNFLRRTGVSPRSFEEQLGKSLINEDYQNILSDLIPVSKSEIEAKIKKDKEEYNVNYVEIDPKNFENVKEATEQELEEYYNQVATDFEEKEKVSYQYAVFTPNDFLNEISVDENEVELYYTENLSEFTEPEQISALVIDIKDGDGAEDKANKILERAKNGEDFIKLIKEVSENKNTEAKWYKRGELDVEVEKVIFENHQAGVSNVIKGKDFYTIVNVLDYKPERIKDISEVKEQISEDVKKGLAPAFAKDKADKIKALIDNGSDIPQDLSWKEVTLAEKGNSPIEFQGLTDKVLEEPTQKAIVVEYGDNVVVVKINEYKENKILPYKDLGELKAKLVKQYKDNKISEATQNFVNQVILDLKDKNLSDEAKARNLKLETIKNFSKNTTQEGFASKPTIREAITKLNKKGDYSQAGVKFEDKFYVFQIDDVIQNNDKIAQDEIIARTDRTREEQREISIKSVLNVLQAQSDIKFGRYIRLD